MPTETATRPCSYSPLVYSSVPPSPAPYKHCPYTRIASKDRQPMASTSLFLRSTAIAYTRKAAEERNLKRKQEKDLLERATQQLQAAILTTWLQTQHSTMQSASAEINSTSRKMLDTQVRFSNDFKSLASKLAADTEEARGPLPNLPTPPTTTLASVIIKTADLSVLSSKFTECMTQLDTTQTD